MNIISIGNTIIDVDQIEDWRFEQGIDYTNIKSRLIIETVSATYSFYDEEAVTGYFKINFAQNGSINSKELETAQEEITKLKQEIEKLKDEKAAYMLSNELNKHLREDLSLVLANVRDALDGRKYDG